MAKEAERLLAETGWLPEPLRLVREDAPAAEATDTPTDVPEEADALPAFLASEAGEAEDGADETVYAIAAE